MKRLTSFLLTLILILSCVGPTAFADEKRTIKMLTFSASIDMNTDYVGVLLEETTGYHVDYQYWTDENQLSLEVASGTDFDIISMRPGMYQTLQSQGALKNLAPFLEEYPDLKSAISDLGWIYCTAEDGGIYGIPRITDPVHVNALGYRTDIFAKYGYKEPDTIDEFTELLVNIKKDTGLIPLTGSSAVEPVIASAFGLTYEYVIDKATDSIVSWLRLPGMKDYLAWMRDAYAAGLIDNDWPINNKTTIAEKMSSGLAVMAKAYHADTLPWVTAWVESGLKDAYIKCFIELEDANGERHVACNGGVSRVDIIPVTASDEDARYTLGMVASRLTEENYWLFNAGIEGTHYYFDSDGYPLPILPIFNDDMNDGDKYQIGRNQYVHPISWMARVHKSQVQWDTFYDANVKAAAYPFEGNVLTYASFPEYTEYRTALEKKCSDYFLQVIAGTASLDTYDSFVAEWEAAGGLAIEKAATQWYHSHADLVAASRQSISPYAEIFGYTFK